MPAGRGAPPCGDDDLLTRGNGRRLTGQAVLGDHEVERAGFQQFSREFISQMTFPSEIIYGVKPPNN